MQFTARRLFDTPGPGLDLVAATVDRVWMDETVMRFAYRCLPLSIANQGGWVVTCPLDFTATWTESGIEFVADDPAEAALWAPFIGERYGQVGIFGFRLPWAFRTDVGTGLFTRGPANDGVPDAMALDAFYDTGEAEAAFTADWKLVAKDRPARFRKGAPVALLMPMPIGLLEAMQPKLVALRDNPELFAAYSRWADGRRSFLADPTRQDGDWQKDYFQGKTQAGVRKHGHKTRLALRPFL